MANFPMEGCLFSHSSADWLSIRQASRLLGVHISTVREWTDQGLIASYRTPGGHRRFSKTALQKFIDQRNQTQAALPSLTEQAITRVREDLRAHPHGDWLQRTSLPDAERIKQRECGQRLLACVVAYVQTPVQRDEWLAQGRRIAHEYGRALAENGMTAGNAARATIHFRQLILKAVLEVQLGARTGDEEDARLFQRVSAFIDEILLALLEVYP